MEVERQIESCFVSIANSRFRDIRVFQSKLVLWNLKIYKDKANKSESVFIMVILEGQAGDAKSITGEEAEKETVKTAVPISLESILYENFVYLQLLSWFSFPTYLLSTFSIFP